MLAHDPPPAEASGILTVPPVCEAACGRALTSAQVGKGARACSPACRAEAFRARRRHKVLLLLDALANELTALRAEVERW